MTLIHKTVLQVIPALGAGGAEQGCIDVAAAIVKQGGRAIIASHNGFRVPELKRIGAEHISLPLHSKNPYIMWRNISRLRKIIREQNVDIVHARSRAPAWSAWRACQNTSAKFITTCHAPYNISGEMKRLYNGSIAHGERVIAISHYVADYLREHYQLPEERINIIHRGIPIERFRADAVTPHRMVQLSDQWRIPDGANVILLPGRLTRWKGHHVLIDAMAKLTRDDVFCVIIGSDQGRTAYRQELEDHIAAQNLHDKVRIVDQCNDMAAAYMLSAVVVSASTDPEGFGRIPVEAQAMGRPIIATDHGGARETVLHGETGWLIPHSDPDALANALSYALSLSATERAVLASKAIAHVNQHFTKTIMTDKTIAVYTSLLEPQAQEHERGAA